MARRMNRRAFLGGAAVSGAGVILLAAGRSARTYAANEKLNLAHVGVGGRGRQLLLRFGGQAEPVAFCDVNESKAAFMYKKHPDVPRFKDFRRMLDKMGKRIDGVVIATPDHTHAVATAAAIRAGKHVYTEKPLTRTVHESRVLRALAREHKVASQMGNQGTASGQFREAVAVLRAGGIGQVKEVHVWNSAGGPSHKTKPQPGGNLDRVPPYLDWDLWLGPAASRPFHVRWLRGWHGWRDFGTGQLGNWASHSANLAFMALKVNELWYADPATKPRLRVEAKVSEINKLSFPRWEIVRWQIPARGELPPITFTWHNGSKAPGSRERLEQLNEGDLDWGDKKEKRWRDHGGAILVGTRGKVRATEHNATYRLLPKKRFEGYKPPAPVLPRSVGHQREWLRACRGQRSALSNFDYAGPLNEFLQLANVATQFAGPLEYDPLAGRIVNHAQADACLRSEYRKGWSL
jgi:hypothetical protein